MKRAIKICTLILCFAAVSFYLAKPLQKGKKRHRHSCEALAGPQGKTFVVIIPSYNNSPWCERNLNSVFDQKYENYRVIYIDDCSTDDTYQKTAAIIKKRSQDERVTLVHNEKNLGAMYNLYRAIMGCRDDEIAVILDGDDWFGHEQVLNRLNEAYADRKVWMTYGSYLDYPSYKMGECARGIPKKILQSNSIRTFDEKGFILSHLKTFYVGLFKQIKREDFIYEGDFLKATYDMAMMYPMAEMAGEHVLYLKDPLYIYNRANPLNDDKVKYHIQKKCKKFVQSLPRYSRLKKLPFAQDSKHPAEEDLNFLMHKEGSTLTREDIENLRFYKNLYEKNLKSTKNVSEIPKTVHFIWLGPAPFPQESVKNIAAWMEQHPGWTFKFWTDIDREPPYPGMIKKLVGAFPFHKLEDCYYNADNFGEKSQLLCYEILFREGGVYADHDTYPVKSLDSIHGSYDFYCGLETLKPSLLSSSVYPSNHLLAVKAGHPILDASMDFIVHHWAQIGLDYLGTDEDAVLSRVYHRTLHGLDAGIKKGADLSGNTDMIFPASAFSSADAKKAFYVCHLQKGLWYKKNNNNEKKVRAYLTQIQKQNETLQYAIILMGLLTLCAALYFFLSIKAIKKKNS